MNIDNIPHAITAACILHNICEIHGESFNDDAWLREIQPDSSFPQPFSTASDGNSDGNSSRPKQVRDALMHYFVKDN